MRYLKVWKKMRYMKVKKMNKIFESLNKKECKPESVNKNECKLEILNKNE